MSLVTYLVDIPSWAPVVGSMVGLGVGIDYALFLVTRHREYLARGVPVDESVGRAVATAGQSGGLAGGTVVMAILGLAVAGVPFITAAGVAISVIVLIMVVASGDAAAGLPRPRRASHQRAAATSRRRAPTAAAGTGWERWGRHVSRHPVALRASASRVLLLALAAPVLALRLGFPDDGTLPHSRTERRAYDLVAEGFGPGHQRSARHRRRHRGRSRPWSPRCSPPSGRTAGSRRSRPVEISAGRLAWRPRRLPHDRASGWGHARHDPPAARRRASRRCSRAAPPQAHVGGQTANWADIGDRVNEPAAGVHLGRRHCCRSCC